MELVKLGATGLHVQVAVRLIGQALGGFALAQRYVGLTVNGLVEFVPAHITCVRGNRDEGLDVCDTRDNSAHAHQTCANDAMRASELSSQRRAV